MPGTFFRGFCRLTLLLNLTILVGFNSAHAAYTLDRWYQMGDDTLFAGGNSAENAANGIAVGSNVGPSGVPGITYDSAATSGANFEGLTAAGANGLPTYAEYGVGGNPAAPLAAAASMNKFGIRFDGVDDYLSAVALNDPRQAATGTSVTYNTTNRGMQMWVYPTTLDGVAQYVIDDADRHSINISITNTWISQMNLDRPNSLAPVATNAWTHLMLVTESSFTNGTILFVNGLAVATHPSQFSLNNVRMNVGANGSLGGDGNDQPPELQTAPGYFEGLIDEIEVFVADDPASPQGYGVFDYTQDNGYFRDVFLPSQSGYGFTLNTATGHNSQSWLKGDINFDGVFDADDLNAFIAHWREEKANLPGTGPQAGDYLSLMGGDLDLDGDTDLSDWIRLRQYNVLHGSPLGSMPLTQLTGVPEPTSAFLAFMAASWAVAARRRAG